MKSTDSQVIAYKTLRYIHEANRTGVTPSLADLQKLADDPNERFLAGIIGELIELGYLRGATVKQYYDGVEIDIAEARVSIDGCEYMNNAAPMRSALTFLGHAFEKALEVALAL